MATALTTITNVSKQAVPVIIESIAAGTANSASDIGPTVATQITMQAGTKLTAETQRLDLGQLDQLRRKGLITYS